MQPPSGALHRSDTRGGTRTRNLLLRREAPYPLGHTGPYILYFGPPPLQAHEGSQASIRKHPGSQHNIQPVDPDSIWDLNSTCRHQGSDDMVLTGAKVIPRPALIAECNTGCIAVGPSTRTLWPSGLRRWLKAPVRKGVGSNPTGVTALWWANRTQTGII